jgi:dTDP-4-amino-4,6-dideoxygalactose transaminase
VGQWGVGSSSLYAIKNLTSGEGGLVANDDAIAEHVRAFRNHGMHNRHKYEMVGSNLRLTDFQAALCLLQIARYPQILATRRHNAESLTRGLDGTPDLLLPQELEGRGHVWHQYTVLVDQNAKLDRYELAKSLLESGIQCGIYYLRPVFDYPCVRDHPPVADTDVPVARSVSRRCLSLPVHPSLNSSDLDRIIESVRSLLTN